MAVLIGEIYLDKLVGDICEIALILSSFSKIRIYDLD
jgi:hypothetical protein